MTDPNPDLPELESLSEGLSRIGTLILLVGMAAAALSRLLP